MNITKNKYAILFLFPMILAFSGIAPAAQMSNSNQAKITMIVPEEIVWKDGPKSLPAGSQYAVLVGDPSKPGIFTMRLKFPPNYQLPAHYHLFTENVTVISGKVYLGHGDKIDKSKSKLFSAGGFVSIPAHVHHFAWTSKKGCVVQLNNMGPWEIIYIDSSKDPRKQ